MNLIERFEARYKELQPGIVYYLGRVSEEHVDRERVPDKAVLLSMLAYFMGQDDVAPKDALRMLALLNVYADIVDDEQDSTPEVLAGFLITESMRIAESLEPYERFFLAMSMMAGRE